MGSVAGASTYGVITLVHMKELVQDVRTEWRSVGDNRHAGVWTSVPMIDRNLRRHSNVSKTVSDV